MNNLLFPKEKISDYILEFRYKGPSFDGVMEIGSLKNELIGLENILRISLQTLYKHKRIDFDPNEVKIFVEAFERGSFKENIKFIFDKLDEHPSIINLGILVTAILGVVIAYKALSVKEMSPELMTKIKDQVQVELLKNPEFRKSLAEIVKPLNVKSDQFYCAVPQGNEIVVNYADKNEFLELANENNGEELNGDHFEILSGRINRVDVDATKRHLGFKVNGSGTSIYATLSDNLRGSILMTSLLDQWVEIEGTTTYQSGIRSHIDIGELKVVVQQQFDFSKIEDGHD